MTFTRGTDYERIPGSWPWSRWKWRLIGTHFWRVRLAPACDLHLEHVSLYTDGTLVLEDGYAIDGVTCGIDTPRSMRAAFIHDALCQLIEAKILEWEHRAAADYEFLDALLADGFGPRWWALARWRVVRLWSELCRAHLRRET